ncbi:5'-3' exonuclease, N-terminal resolvase-like domain protein [[Clostridium] sordellii ATCC 9714]|nr:5'-3' exonuclease, N-terminal resolvase-like domain protein [[Clostridium] sordellii ATCC 9714] [Paeniclostridium sordellii ATCC 9714]
MDLFDLLEQNQEKEENEKVDMSYSDQIRLNSYVGSRINTDFRIKNRKINNKEEVPTNEEVKVSINNECDEDNKIEEIQINETISKEKLLVIDGSSLLSTSYFARLPRQVMFAKTIEEKEQYYDKILQTKDGVYTNGVYGFMQVMLSMIKNQNPTHLAVV